MAFKNKISVLYGDDEIEIDNTGETLMSLLKAHQIPIPNGCAGNGTCGQCRIQVLEGDIEPSLDDLWQIRQGKLKENERLACKAVAKQECSIKVPLLKGAFIAVTSHTKQDGINNKFDIGKVVPVVLQKDSIDGLTQIRYKLGEDKYVHPVALEQLSSLIHDLSKDHQSIYYCLCIEDGIYQISDNEEKIQAYGVAIDIGTTTIGFALWDILNGIKIGSLGVLNRQRNYGFDVISRTTYSNEGNEKILQNAVREDLMEGIVGICRQNNIDLSAVHRIVIAGNTIMTHMLLGLSCKSIGSYPFMPTLREPYPLSIVELMGKPMDINGQVVLLPCISGFVGGDIFAGIQYLKLLDRDEIVLLLDLGTNGEMVIGNKHHLLCSSTACGPAFEGGNITYGIGSIEGAISYCEIEGFVVKYKTINDKGPVGICGSGVLSLVQAALSKKWIDETGCLIEDLEDVGIYIDKLSSGEGIFLKQQDIREVQLAKAAVRAGIETLIKSYDCNLSDIAKVYVAGGFGFHVQPECLITLGLIPRILQDRIEVVGNSALGGAEDCLFYTQEELKRLYTIIQKVENIDLGTSQYFQEMFVEHMMFTGLQ